MGGWEIGDGRRGTTKHTKYTKEKKGQGGAGWGRIWNSGNQERRGKEEE